MNGAALLSIFGVVKNQEYFDDVQPTPRKQEIKVPNKMGAH